MAKHKTDRTLALVRITTQLSFHFNMSDLELWNVSLLTAYMLASLANRYVPHCCTKVNYIEMALC